MTFDGTRVKVEFFSPMVQGTNNSTTATIVLLRDSTVIGWAQIGGVTTTPVGGALAALAFDTPSAASHTYKVAAFTSSAANPINVQAGTGGSGALLPAYLRVTKA